MNILLFLDNVRLGITSLRLPRSEEERLNSITRCCIASNAKLSITYSVGTLEPRYVHRTRTLPNFRFTLYLDNTYLETHSIILYSKLGN